jgi:hypothetical protein
MNLSFFVLCLSFVDLHFVNVRTFFDLVKGFVHFLTCLGEELKGDCRSFADSMTNIPIDHSEFNSALLKDVDANIEKLGIEQMSLNYDSLELCTSSYS